jgi:hypothetical protein
MTECCTCRDKQLRARMFEAEREYLAQRTPSELVDYARVVARVKHDWGLCEYCNRQLFIMLQ